MGLPNSCSLMSRYGNISFSTQPLPESLLRWKGKVFADWSRGLAFILFIVELFHWVLCLTKSLIYFSVVLVGLLFSSLDCLFGSCSLFCMQVFYLVFDLKVVVIQDQITTIGEDSWIRFSSCTCTCPWLTCTHMQNLKTAHQPSWIDLLFLSPTSRMLVA